MRWTCILCFALALAPALASAQTGEEEEAVAMSADEAPAPAEAAEDVEPEPADPPPAAPREATTSDPMPSTGTSTVVVNERDAQLRAEQEAMLAEEAQGEQLQEAGEEEDDGDSLDHEFQLGIRAGIGVPFVFALRYNDGPQCDTTGEQFCLFVGSTVITFDVSFGVSNDIELVLGGRIGAIGVEPTENNNGQILLGIRAYVSPESIAKVYFAPSVVLDLTPGSPLVPNWGDVDFGVRGAFGVAIDPIRYLGLYVELGVNILFLRSFGISPDLTGGFQVRFP